MSKLRKQITFDLDTKALKVYYPGESWNRAYDLIRRHMEHNGFRWLQGSVYVSKSATSSYRITRILQELLNDHPWLHKCMRDCREANVGKEHSKNHIFKKDTFIPTRDELNERK